MQKKGGDDQQQLVFVVETCQNCKEHHWNTRHDEAKYLDFFNRVSAAITQRLPGAVVLRNQIPKAYLPYDLYCNLIPNEDDKVPVFDQVPRTGSFEVSYKGMLIFSKLQSGFWPNSQLIGEKCMLLVQDEKDSKDISKYLAGSPAKAAAPSRASKGRNFSRSPLRGGAAEQSSLSQINKTSDSSQPLRVESPNHKFSQATPSKGSQKNMAPQAQSAQGQHKAQPVVQPIAEQQQQQQASPTPTSMMAQIQAQKEAEDSAIKEQAQKEEAAQSQKAEAESKAAAMEAEKQKQRDQEYEKMKREAEESKKKLEQAQMKKEYEESKKRLEQAQMKKEFEESKKRLEYEQMKKDKEASFKALQEASAKKQDDGKEEKQPAPSTFEKQKTQSGDPKFVNADQQSKESTVPVKHQDTAKTVEGKLIPAVNHEEPSEVQPEEDILVGSHLKSPEAILGFPVFPEGTKSLLKKHLSKQIWDELKNAKDSHGFTFKQAIFSGCKNTDSGVGVYAGSHDSYKAFSALFDKIIEDYHGHKKVDVHHSDMDYSKLNTPPFTPEEAKLIKSTRIRVGRNLADYPLGPGISKEQRKEVETKVTQALTTFSGELQGKYYSLLSLSDAERKQLIEDHFLFKEGDRFLEACGLNRDWPDGRGIFHNNEKSFLVWVNEEDQLRIISMQQGSDIGAVFTRLSKACSHIETVAKFAHDKNLGYITSCPTNLGTALRASVHIHLPNLGQKKDQFQAIADQFHVQIRGAHGEHTETNDHIYDISNKRRLGMSEVQLVQDMYNGVKAMIKKELELAPPPKVEDQKVGPHLKVVEDLKGFPIFPEGTKSLLKKYLTKEMFLKHKDEKDKFGFSFKQAIFSGCQNTDSGIGIYAGSHDSYYKFADLFDKVIEDYHGHKKDDHHISDMDYSKLKTPPLPEEDAKMIKSTRIRVGRNLADYPLGPGLSKEQRKEIETKVSQALTSFEGDLAGKYYALSSLSDSERKQLIEDHFLFKEGDRFLEACGLNRDWPDGRGIFHNNEKTFLVWVNEEDQLRIISMQQGADIGAVFTRLSKACAHIEKVAKFQHDEHLGYITSCPTNLGTALRASVHIHLPNLGLKQDVFQSIADKFYVQIRGAHGEHTETNDHIYDISNKRRLGRSEVDLVQDMYNGVKAMIEKEKELRPKEEAKHQAPHDHSAQSVEAGSHLKSHSELVTCPKFPQGTKSLLCKYLNQEIWDHLHDKKDKFGFTFPEVIFTGCKNVDSQIGVIAGSHDSYKVFAELFDQIIEDYHGHKKEAHHVSDMDYTKLNTPPFSEEEAKLIKSTRIRVGRNLDGLPLGPGITKEQRKEIEGKVSQALASLDGELEGKYNALSSMTAEEKQQLIADHFLFKEADRFLDACGLNRDWPENRGIYHNNDKTFLVWVNEEDQLRIISMQQGADIGAVFTRLSKACSQIEKHCKFSHDEHLGFITSCPTNLGTALRASVHIHLSKLGPLKEEFQAIADKYHVQIRGIHGEHSESADHIYDISNKRRLGLSEVNLIQDMYNGVKAMIQKELSL